MLVDEVSKQVEQRPTAQSHEELKNGILGKFIFLETHINFVTSSKA